MQLTSTPVPARSFPIDFVKPNVERPQRPPWDAGGVDEHVEPAELIDDAVDGGIGVGRPRNVALDREHVSVDPLTVEHRHAGATVPKPLSGRRPDSAGAAGHERDPALEVVAVHRRVLITLPDGVR